MGCLLLYIDGALCLNEGLSPFEANKELNTHSMYIFTLYVHHRSLCMTQDIKRWSETSEFPFWVAMGCLLLYIDGALCLNEGLSPFEANKELNTHSMYIFTLYVHHRSLCMTQDIKRWSE